jgi:predicted CXXCH cytochrome family protein
VRHVGRLVVLTCLLVDATAMDASAQSPAGRAVDLFRDDVHARAGLRCDACHTGAAAPYGPIERTKIAPLCGSCHADVASMKKVNPQARTDEYAQYLASTHGTRMTSGETRVATCSDCHGAHGIRPVTDTRSPVAPQNVATTCARCHSDPVRMSAFGHQGDPPADWRASVHAAALLKRGDLSAPTCNTCHGSHGVPPGGATSAAQVCAQCHVREAELYAKSPKKAVFDLVGGGCVTCHSNHKIEKPTDAMIGMKDPALCATCHNDQMKGAAVITGMRRRLEDLGASIDRAGAILDRAARAGMLVDDGRLVLREAEQDRILARVNIHAFADEPLAATAAKGIAAAARAEDVGTAAMGELRYRRDGLAVATLLIVGFLATLWVKIRRLPAGPPPEGTA